MIHQRLGRGCRSAARAAAAAAVVMAAGLAVALLVPPVAARAESAVLQGLDKITARISTFEAPVGQPARFGSLEITVRRCQKAPPEEPPESAAFLEIVDVRPDSPEVLLFSGWMFASSPAISALEHPVYDVWVIDCKSDAASEPPADPEADPQADPPADQTTDQPADQPADQPDSAAGEDGD